MQEFRSRTHRQLNTDNLLYRGKKEGRKSENRKSFLIFMPNRGSPCKIDAERENDSAWLCDRDHDHRK